MVHVLLAHLGRRGPRKSGYRLTYAKLGIMSPRYAVFVPGLLAMGQPMLVRTQALLDLVFLRLRERKLGTEGG